MWDGEIDPVFRKAVKLLHSTSSDSAEKIRNLLDEMIQKRHGSSKMLANTLSEKVLAEENSAHMYSDTEASSSNIAEHTNVTMKRSTVVNPVIKSVPGDDDMKVDESDLIIEQNDLIMGEEYLEVYLTDEDVVSVSDDDGLILDETNSIVEEADLIMEQDLHQDLHLIMEEDGLQVFATN